MEHVSFFDQPTVSLAETSLLTPTPSEARSSPGPGKDEKKPTKKRKSWGQELPTPKTNLPPRKRAKTEDEKEQRRIERVLRNRQAAQSSRERKRLEVEKLEGERDIITNENRALKARLMAVEEEKFNMKQQLTQMRELLRKNGVPLSSPPTSPILGADMFKEPVIKQEFNGLRSMFETDRQTNNLISPIQSDSNADETGDPSEPTVLDLAQHPAAMLCGLQCQSKTPSEPGYPPQLHAATQFPQPPLPLHQFLIAHSITCSSLAIPLFQLLASLKKGTRLKAETMTPTMFNLILWLLSTPRSPLRPSTLTATLSAVTTSSTRSHSTSTLPTTQSSTFRTSLLRRLLTCSPALARPLKDATARALHEKAKYALRERSKDSRRTAEDENRGEQIEQVVTSKVEVWRLMTVALVTDQCIKQRAKSRP